MPVMSPVLEPSWLERESIFERPRRNCRVILSRRKLLRTALTAATVSGLRAQSTWGVPVLDIHLHPRRNGDSELAHLQGSVVTKAVLLTGLPLESRAKDLVAKYPDSFVRFTGTDVRAPNAVDLLRDSLKGGAIGLGELKSPVSVDGPEMRRIYELAADFNLPLLMHFQEGSF